MQLQDCAKNQRVINRETGQVGTVRDLHRSELEATVVYDNGNTTRSALRALEPAVETAETIDTTDPTETSGPQRSCPQCGASVPVQVVTCPKCGFQYGVAKRKSGSSLKVIVLLLVAGAAAYLVWKFGLLD